MKQTSVLFVCPGNGPRSIIAAAMANHFPRNRFRARSADIHPPLPVYMADESVTHVLRRYGIAYKYPTRQGKRRTPKTVANVGTFAKLVVCMQPVHHHIIAKAASILKGSYWVFWEVPIPEVGNMPSYIHTVDILRRKIGDLARQFH